MCWIRALACHSAGIACSSGGYPGYSDRAAQSCQCSPPKLQPLDVATSKQQSSAIKRTILQELGKELVTGQDSMAAMVAAAQAGAQTMGAYDRRSSLVQPTMAMNLLRSLNNLLDDAKRLSSDFAANLSRLEEQATERVQWAALKFSSSNLEIAAQHVQHVRQEQHAAFCPTIVRFAMLLTDLQGRLRQNIAQAQSCIQRLHTQIGPLGPQLQQDLHACKCNLNHLTIAFDKLQRFVPSHLQQQWDAYRDAISSEYFTTQLQQQAAHNAASAHAPTMSAGHQVGNNAPEQVMEGPNMLPALAGPTARLLRPNPSSSTGSVPPLPAHFTPPVMCMPQAGLVRPASTSPTTAPTMQMAPGAPSPPPLLLPLPHPTPAPAALQVPTAEPRHPHPPPSLPKVPKMPTAPPQPPGVLASSLPPSPPPALTPAGAPMPPTQEKATRQARRRARTTHYCLGTDSEEQEAVVPKATRQARRRPRRHTPPPTGNLGQNIEVPKTRKCRGRDDHALPSKRSGNRNKDATPAVAQHTDDDSLTSIINKAVDEASQQLLQDVSSAPLGPMTEPAGSPGFLRVSSQEHGIVMATFRHPTQSPFPQMQIGNGSIPLSHCLPTLHLGVSASTVQHGYSSAVAMPLDLPSVDDASLLDQCMDIFSDDDDDNGNDVLEFNMTDMINDLNSEPVIWREDVVADVTAGIALQQDAAADAALIRKAYMEMCSD